MTNKHTPNEYKDIPKAIEYVSQNKLNAVLYAVT